MSNSAIGRTAQGAPGGATEIMATRASRRKFIRELMARDPYINANGYFIDGCALSNDYHWQRGAMLCAGFDACLRNASTYLAQANLKTRRKPRPTYKFLPELVELARKYWRRRGWPDVELTPAAFAAALIAHGYRVEHAIKGGRLAGLKIYVINPERRRSKRAETVSHQISDARA